MPLKEGTSVSIMGGDFKGNTGKVVGHHAHDPITYAVVLDKPLTKTVSRDVDLGGGRKVSESEEVSFSRVEVAEADVSAS